MSVKVLGMVDYGDGKDKQLATLKNADEREHEARAYFDERHLWWTIG
jgi:hypothetical protein